MLGFLLLHVNLHLPLEYFISLLQAGLENLHEFVELLPGVLGHEVDSQPGLAYLHNRVFDAIDVHACIHHQPGDQSADDLVADEQRQDGAGVAKNFVAPRLQLLSQVVVVLHHLLPELAAVLGPQDAELGQGGRGLHWVDGVGEHVGRRVVLQILDDLRVVASDEADVGAEALATRSDQEHVGQIL